MTDHFLWFNVQMNRYSRKWNTPYKSLIVTAGEFQKCNPTFWTPICNKNLFQTRKNATETYGMLQTGLAKGLGLELLCWGFTGVQEEIQSEEASTLQIESVEFPLGRYTSPLLHPCQRLFDQDGHLDSYSSSLESRPCFLWSLVIP